MGLEWIKDYGVPIMAVITVWVFYRRLRVDTQLAKFRETIGYLEKREKEQRDAWDKLKESLKTFNGTGIFPETEAKAYFSRLEFVSLLIRKEAFDDEIVYTLWWMHFIEPMNDPAIAKWIGGLKLKDSTVYEHYFWLCKKWLSRIHDEQSGVKRKISRM